MSSQGAMQQLTDRFLNDADFREQMKRDPEGTADRQALRSIEWGLPDEQLNERASKERVQLSLLSHQA